MILVSNLSPPEVCIEQTHFMITWGSSSLSQLSRLRFLLSCCGVYKAVLHGNKSVTRFVIKFVMRNVTQNLQQKYLRKYSLYYTSKFICYRSLRIPCVPYFGGNDEFEFLTLIYLIRWETCA